MQSFVIAQTTGVSLSRVITVLSIVLSMVSLGIAFWKARALLPLRPGFDYARLGIQVIAVLVMAALSGVATPIGLITGAALIGLALGYFQAASLEIFVEQGSVRLRRSLIGVAIWGGGLIVMQAAGLANRAGVVRLGQAIAWFSIGVTVGMLAGRRPRVEDALNQTARVAVIALVVAGTASLAIITQPTPVAAQATQCPTPPSGWSFTNGGGGNCSYESVGRTAAVSASGGGKCGAELAEHWAGFSGSPGAGGIVNVKSDGSNGFEKWLVLTSNSVVSIAASNVDGPGTAEKFRAAAEEYGQLNYPACTASPATTAAPTGTNAPAPTTTAAPRTTIVTETFPDDPPDVAEIPDEGAALTSTTTSPPSSSTTTTNAPTTSTTEPRVESTTSSASPETTVSASSVPNGLETATPQLPASPPGADAGEEDVTEEEAVQQAVAGLLLAGLLGLISWGEAFQAVDALSGSAPGTAQATHGHLQQQYPDYRSTPAGAPPTAPSAPPGPQTPPGPISGPGSTPTSTYIPSNTTGDGGGAGGNGGGPRTWYEPEGGASGSDPGESGASDGDSSGAESTEAGNTAGADTGDGPAFGDWGTPSSGQEPANGMDIETDNGDGTSSGQRANGDRFERTENPDAIGNEVRSQETTVHPDGSTTEEAIRADGSRSTSTTSKDGSTFTLTNDDGKGNTSSFTQHRAGHTVSTSTDGVTTSTTETRDGVETVITTGPNGQITRIHDPETGHRHSTETRPDGTRVETTGSGSDKTVTTTSQQGTQTITERKNPGDMVERTVTDSADPSRTTTTTQQGGRLESESETVTHPDGGKTTTKTDYAPDGSVRGRTVDGPGGRFESHTPRPDGGMDVFTSNPDGTSSRSQLDQSGNVVQPEPDRVTESAAPEPNETAPSRPPLPPSAVADDLENNPHLQRLVGKDELREAGDFLRDSSSDELSLTPPAPGTTLTDKAPVSVTAGTPAAVGDNVELPVNALGLPAGKVTLEIDDNGRLRATIGVNSMGRAAAENVLGDDFDNMLDDVQQRVSFQVDDINTELDRTGRRLSSVTVSPSGELVFRTEPNGKGG